MIDKTRRSILKTGFIGAVAGSTVISGLSLYKVKEAKATTAEHPYVYPGGLDVDTTRQLAYDSFYGYALTGHSGCAFATFHALISQLAAMENPPGPYSQIPTQMMEWAAGGVAGYGSICGTLNGACAAIGLICGNAQAKIIIGDLLNWSAETLLPTLLTENNLITREDRSYESEPECFPRQSLPYVRDKLVSGNRLCQRLRATYRKVCPVSR